MRMKKLVIIKKNFEFFSQLSCNHFNNILRLFHVLPSFPFTTNETIHNY